jgi:5'-nucleotidase (lipoprotein e(P4) family)
MNPRNHAAPVLIALVLVTLMLGGCTVHKTTTIINPPVPEAHELMNSVLWVQTSAEYVATCREIYGLAAFRLEEALADTLWTALPGWDQTYSGLPPAVILDVDETALDNSAFEAGLITHLEEYAKPIWDAWIAKEAAPPIPGAREFIEGAHDRGVDVYFVTNRDEDTKEHTVANLRSCFGSWITDEQVLTRGERKEWRGDKTSRREYLAATHRILLLIGDDLGDFTEAGDVPPWARLRAAEAYKDLWGTKWIMLPNPMYGTWEQALYGYDRRIDRAAKLKHKQGSLRAPD